MKILYKIMVIGVIWSILLNYPHELRAEIISCTNGKYADGNDCESCGANCDWSFDTVTGKLSVTGSGNMNNYSTYKNEQDNLEYSTAPWGQYRNNIKSLEVSGLSNIGNRAFCYLGLKDVKMDDTITKVGEAAFAWGNSVGSIILPDSLTNLGYIAFRAAGLQSITIPATMKNFGTGSLGGQKSIIENMEIICLGSEAECDILREKLKNYNHYGLDYSYETLDLSQKVVTANEDQCVSSNYYWNGTECMKEPDTSKRTCCAEVCKDLGGGYCSRVRYTMSEADAATSNDNENWIEWTFE